MLPPDEKEHIIERVKFEENIRSELGHRNKRPSAWWNSKIALLLIGSLITGILVPWFQFIQNRLEWRRQNAFEHTQFRLETARDCLKEFVSLQVSIGEVLTYPQSLTETIRIESDQAEQLMKKFEQLRVRLSEQSARVLPLIMYFDEAETIRSDYQKHAALISVYLDKVSRLIYKVNTVTTTGASTTDSQKDIQEFSKGLEEDMHEFERLYTNIFNAIRTEIGRLENERLRFL